MVLSRAARAVTDWSLAVYLLKLDWHVLLQVGHRNEEVQGTSARRDTEVGHADHIAARVQQRASAAARVHGDVALDVLEIVDLPDPAHHSFGHGELELLREWRTDREYLAAFDELLPAHRQGRQPCAIEVDDRQIALLARRDDLAVALLPGSGIHLDQLGPGDDVLSGDDRAVLGNHEPAARSLVGGDGRDRGLDQIDVVLEVA